MKEKKYDTNTLAAIAAINDNIGSDMWYQFFRDEYRSRGGRPEMCARTLERIFEWFPACVDYVPYARYGANMAFKIRAVRKIDVSM